MNLVDCTLRDGGYYNDWDFQPQLILDYLDAMQAAEVTFVELGFRSFDNTGFRGACAFTTDNFIRSLEVSSDLKLGVMVNAAELIKYSGGPLLAIQELFVKSEHSPVSLVRLACHFHECEAILPACAWLKENGYLVGINLMQVADRSETELETFAHLLDDRIVDVFYLADSLGTLDPHRTAQIIEILRRCWKGHIGIHTHDNMGLAVANSLRAMDEGVTWVDSTVTGMGRGPGNAQTEYMLIELEKRTGKRRELGPLLSVIRNHFSPLQQQYGWGKNAYYYLAGQYGIHPTYIQEMLSDPRYGESDMLSVIKHLSKLGAKRYNAEALEIGRQMYGGESQGSWVPSRDMADKQVLILGSGPSVLAHRPAIESFIREKKPFVIGLNAYSCVDTKLINVRAACHPFRLLADCNQFRLLKQPLVVPLSNLPDIVRETLSNVEHLDFGLVVKPQSFEYLETGAITPSCLVVAYALAIATSGRAREILLVGFDGYSADDPRTAEMDSLLAQYQNSDGCRPLLAVTATRYKLPVSSIYAL